MSFSTLAPVVRAVARPSRFVAAGQAAVLTLLVAGAAGWTMFDRTVTLEVDGQAQQVRILGTEVSDVLAKADVEIGSRDLVSPAVDETVADGETVVVRYARQLTVADPAGEERTFWTTELTVDEALSAAGLRTQDAWLSTSRSAGISRSGMSLTLSVPKDVTVVADGETREVSSPGPRVADLLAELGIKLDADDRVDVETHTVLTAGQVVTVQRVDVADVVEAVAVPRGVRTVSDDDLLVGKEEVREAGSDGEQQVTYRVTTVDGTEESREETARTTTKEPVERVVAKGTKPKPAPVAAPAAPAPSSGGSSGGSAPAPAPAAPAPPAGGGVTSLNWAALAACESGGNPSIVSSNGLYHGLYQFDRGTWQSMGGSGVASQAPASEQTARAQALYSARGASPWPHCGPRLFS